jgi:DNA-binding NarL/FixJ family response regulator
MIRVAIADDQALVRTGFRVILDAEPDLEVVGEAGDGHEIVDLVQARRPDVVLMDVRMPNLDGIEATRRLTVLPQPPRVLMLTTFDLDEYVYEALRAGASGFLLKDAGADELLHAVRVVAAGEALLSPSITRRLIADYSRRPPASEQPAALAELTPRELEVLRLLARGLSNAEIAGELVLGDATVKTHVARVFQKLDLHDRAQAVVLAYETGLVTPGKPRTPTPRDRSAGGSARRRRRVDQPRLAPTFTGPPTHARSETSAKHPFADDSRQNRKRVCAGAFARFVIAPKRERFDFATLPPGVRGSGGRMTVGSCPLGGLFAEAEAGLVGCAVAEGDG